MGKLQTGLPPDAYCPLKLGGYTHLGKPLLSSPLIITSTHHTQYHNNIRITCYTINYRHKFTSLSVYTYRPSSIQFTTVYLTTICTHITGVLSPSTCSLSIFTIVHVQLFPTHFWLLSLSLFNVHQYLQHTLLHHKHCSISPYIRFISVFLGQGAATHSYTLSKEAEPSPVPRHRTPHKFCKVR